MTQFDSKNMSSVNNIAGKDSGWQKVLTHKLTHWGPAIDNGCFWVYYTFNNVWKTYMFMHPCILVSSKLVRKIGIGPYNGSPRVSQNHWPSPFCFSPPTFSCSAG